MDRGGVGRGKRRRKGRLKNGQFPSSTTNAHERQTTDAKKDWKMVISPKKAR